MENPITFLSEIPMQAYCCQWFWNTFISERRMLHCNMNNSYNRIAGAHAKALGVADGVSDTEFIDYGEVFFLEFKMPGKTQSQVQLDFQAKVEARGHTYLIIYSFEDFHKFIASRLKLRNNG